MTRKRKWLWILLFVGVALLLGILATGWNIVLFRDYEELVQLAQDISISRNPIIRSDRPLIQMILGTLGFIAALSLTILLFIKLLSEMRLNQIQAEFLAAVSHELKTPIAAIELSSGLLMSGDLGESDVRKLWNSHQLELSRLKEEVNALLEAAQLPFKSSYKSTDEVHLETWLSETLTSWQHLMGPDIQLVREGDPLAFSIRTDLKSLHLIMNNLLSNARKFSRTQASVIIRTRQWPRRNQRFTPRWQIQVIDSGWGFKPEDAKKIFHRFYRSKSAAPHAISGTGLGLYLAQSASARLKLKLKGCSLGDAQGAVLL